MRRALENNIFKRIFEKPLKSSKYRSKKRERERDRERESIFISRYGIKTTDLAAVGIYLHCVVFRKMRYRRGGKV